MTALRELPNIGHEMENKLYAVGIDTAEALRQIGARQAFCRLKAAYPRVCLVHLYTLEGAVNGIPFNTLPEDCKKQLKAFSDSLKK